MLGEVVASRGADAPSKAGSAPRLKMDRMLLWTGCRSPLWLAGIGARLPQIRGSGSATAPAETSVTGPVASSQSASTEARFWRMGGHSDSGGGTSRGVKSGPRTGPASPGPPTRATRKAGPSGRPGTTAFRPRRRPPRRWRRAGALAGSRSTPLSARYASVVLVPLPAGSSRQGANAQLATREKRGDGGVAEGLVRPRTASAGSLAAASRVFGSRRRSGRCPPAGAGRSGRSRDCRVLGAEASRLVGSRS